MRKKGSWSALKKHLQRCYKYSEPEDSDDSTQEFGTSSDGVATGKPRDDHPAVDSSENREPSTSDSICEYVDGEQEQHEVIKVKHRNRSLAEELGALPVSPVRLTPCNAPGAAPFPPSRPEDGGATFNNVYGAGSVGKPTSSTSAGVEADTCTAVGRGRCHVLGKLSQSGRGRARGASLEKLNVQKRYNAFGRGTDVDNAAYTDCATSWSESSSSQGRLIRSLEKELEIQPTLTVSTRMSRTGPRRRIPRTDPHSRAAAAFGIKHGWNASTRTAQDFQALLRDRERAVMKRERALKYARSIRMLRHDARQNGELWPADAGAAERNPDKPGWVWSWLERAARMGANGARDNRIFDNDSNPHNGISESDLSVQSTIAICTTGPIPADGPQCSDHDEFRSPSLHEQHEAKAHCVNVPSSDHASRAPGYCKSRCLQRVTDQLAMGIKDSAHPEDAQEQIIREDRTSSGEPQYSPVSVAKLKFARFCGTRGSLNCWTNHLEAERRLQDEDDDQDHSPVESVGSCAAPVAIRSSKYKLSSHFNGGAQRVRSCGGTQLKMLNSNLQSRGRVDFVPARPSAATEHDADSIGSTATSLRKKLWKP